MADKSTLVCCNACSAMRSIKLAPECFCGETAYKPAPPLPKTALESLTTPKPTWRRGDPIRWWNRERWWYGVVDHQEGERVLVIETAKGEDRAGGKAGWRRADLIERDTDAPTDGYYAMRP